MSPIPRLTSTISVLLRTGVVRRLFHGDNKYRSKRSSSGLDFEPTNTLQVQFILTLTAICIVSNSSPILDYERWARS